MLTLVYLVHFGCGLPLISYSTLCSHLSGGGCRVGLVHNEVLCGAQLDQELRYIVNVDVCQRTCRGRFKQRPQGRHEGLLYQSLITSEVQYTYTGILQLAMGFNPFMHVVPNTPCLYMYWSYLFYQSNFQNGFEGEMLIRTQHTYPL